MLPRVIYTWRNQYSNGDDLTIDQSMIVEYTSLERKKEEMHIKRRPAIIQN